MKEGRIVLMAVLFVSSSLFAIAGILSFNGDLAYVAKNNPNPFSEFSQTMMEDFFVMVFSTMIAIATFILMMYGIFYKKKQSEKKSIPVTTPKMALCKPTKL